MPPKKPQQRIRQTNKSQEAKRFSSVKMPQKSEIEQKSLMHSADPAAFDPIPGDGMFNVVENSKYWPPPSLEEVMKLSGKTADLADGMDLYDRRDDEAKAKKQHAAKIKGELNHPRGKEPKNKKVRLESDDEKSASASDDE